MNTNLPFQPRYEKFRSLCVRVKILGQPANPGSSPSMLLLCPCLDQVLWRRIQHEEGLDEREETETGAETVWDRIGTSTCTRSPASLVALVGAHSLDELRS